MEFDALKDFSDEEYDTFISSVLEEASQALNASHDLQTARNEITAYLNRMYKAHLSSEEATDYFCVSTNCVIDRVRTSNLSSDVLVALFDEVHDEYRKNQMQR